MNNVGDFTCHDSRVATRGPSSAAKFLQPPLGNIVPDYNTRMNSRPTRITRAKIIYTEDHEDPPSSVLQGRTGKRKRTNGKSSAPTKRTSSDSSSLTSLEESQDDYSPLESSGRTSKKLRAVGTNGLPHPGVLEARRVHALSYHTSHLTGLCSDISASLLDWFDRVKADREMPWRKDIQDLSACTEQQKGQRAYEVETVKSYYLRWMSRFPTIFELSKANVEQVNEYWQGLGYYSRASRLLSGAKKVVENFNGILPEDPIVMEKEVDGIGPYSAGAIASIAYAKAVPMVDGNVHRVLSRLSALHAPQAAKATTKFLWSLAANLVPQHRPGDFNQALMELGATVCKPRDAICSACPLTRWCRAYQERESLLHDGDGLIPSAVGDDIEDTCNLCHPIGTSSSSSQHVLIYPMAKERKKPGVREVAVAVVLWKERTSEVNGYTLENILSAKGQTKSLLIKRPEKGLLAGLWEFPSIDLPESNDSTTSSRLTLLESLLQETLEEPIPVSTRRERTTGNKSSPLSSQNSFLVPLCTGDLPDIGHVFSHLKVTYKPIALIIDSPNPPNLKNPAKIDSLAKPGQAIWVSCSQIMSSNIGNPHKKVWSGLLDHGAA